VELGKQTASGLRRALAGRNRGDAGDQENLAPIQSFYLDMLFRGKIPG
jgi:hypothetical protein